MSLNEMLSDKNMSELTFMYSNSKSEFMSYNNICYACRYALLYP